MGHLPVLLLPGTLCDGALFKRQIELFRKFAPRVEVVEFNQQQNLLEMAESVKQLIPHDTGAALVGFSMGGMVALALAGRNPQLVAKLALINSNTHTEIPERRRARQEHLSEARSKGIAAVVEKYYLPHYLHRQEPAHQRLILEMAERLGVDCFEAQLKALATRSDSREILLKIHCPTLIIGSDNDLLCPPALQIAMHEIAPRSDLVLLGDCGHFSILERPEAANSVLANWYTDTG